MRTLNVDFVPKPRPRWLFWLGLTLALLGLCIDQAWRAAQLRQRKQQIYIEVAVLRAEIGRLSRSNDLSPARTDLEPAYARDAQDLVKLARFPLALVLASIENAQVQGIRVTAIDVNTVVGLVRLELEFTDHESLSRYLESINAGETIKHWTLLQAQAPIAGTQGAATLAGGWRIEE